MRKIVQCSIALMWAALAVTGCTHVPESHASTKAAAAAWHPVDAATGQISDIAGLSALAEAFPDSSSVRLRLLNAHAAAGDGDGVFAAASWLARRGYTFGPGTREQLIALVGSDHAAEMAEPLSQAAGPILASELFATVPAEARLVEAIAFDPRNGNLGVTAVVSGEVWWRVEREWQPRALEGIRNPSGIAVARDGIRIASGDLGMIPEGEGGFSGLTLIADTDPPVRAIPAPEGVNLSDLLLSEDGTVYASDPLGGGVYRLDPGSLELAALVPPGTLRSPQGMALSEDGALLYVSDYRYGLAIVDLASGEVSRLESEVGVLLDGIDGLWRAGRELVAIQNGIEPMRIAAFTLDRSGRRVVSYRVIERDHPEWTEPLGGTVREGRLYYIATGQWQSYEPGGALREGAEPLPTQIRRLDIGETGPQPP